MRTLYFDIDGVLLDYDEVQRPPFQGGALQRRIEQLGFDRLFCVSSWVDIFDSGIDDKPTERLKHDIQKLLSDIFPDRGWFLERLVLGHQNDFRCRHINLEGDWFYIDDWADKFFAEQFGEELFQEHLGERVLQVNPHGDGSDILRWLDEIVPKVTSPRGSEERNGDE